MFDKMSDEENDLQTSDYFSESTPKSCKSIRLDHKYSLSPTNSVTTSDSSLTSNSRLKLIKKQKQFKRRRLFGKEIESNKRDSNWTPLSERRQLAIALELSSSESQSSSHKTNNALISSNTPLKSGVQKVRRNHKGETGLHIAAIKGDLNTVKQIIGDNKYSIDCQDFAGWSPIHEACNRGHFAIVEALLEAGSDVNVRGYNNDTPLIDAAVNGHYQLVELLLKYGADYTLKNNCNKSAVEVTKSLRVLQIINSYIEEKMRKNGTNCKDKPQSSSPSNNSHVNPSSPRLTLRFQSIKETKQTTGATNSISFDSAMASNKTYSVSTASEKDVENSECDKESNPKDSTSNGTSNVGSTETNVPKVPPLRIVLPANTSNTTSSMSVSTTSNNGSHSSQTPSVTSSTSSIGTKFPYIVSSEESFPSESESASGAVSSQRITRSSQRVAQQQSQKSNTSMEHQSDSEESALHTSHTDSQHPRKRKIRNNNNTNDSKGLANNSSNASNGDNDNDSSSSTSSVNLIAKDVSPFALPQTNCYQMFLSIRKNVDKKRREMYSVPPKAPQGFDDYLINRCSYILAKNKDTEGGNDGTPTLVKPSMTAPPTALSGSRMYDIYVGQEKERYKLKVQQLIERQKLILSSEQEILRVHGRAARAMANQSVPFSVCSILKDEEIYNIFESESEQNDNIANQLKNEKGLTAGTSGLSANRTRYNGRLFFSWLQDVSDKWEKTKKVMLLRHKKESESLLAMQRLEWEWKLKEFGLCDLKTSPNIDDKHVPKVYVSDNFELTV